MKRKIVFISILIVILISFFIVLLFKNNNQKQERLKIENNNNILDTIESHYNKFVSTNKKTKLYKKENDQYIEHGRINEGVFLQLDEISIDMDTQYFYIKDLDLYISYEDVEPVEEIKKEDRYQNYIYFNKNIITNEKTNFYDKDDNFLLSIDESFDFAILVLEEDRYGVIYLNELVYVHSEDVKSTYDNQNTDLKNKNKIKTLTYHFIYNSETSSCNQSICQSLEQFESHLKYIRENDYFTLNLDELSMYLDGKIQIPEKSIVLTIDDGTMFDLEAINLLEKYKVNATLFVITSWVGTENLKSDYLALESHTDNMHNQYECPGYGNQGGGILCLPEEQVLNDLKTSQEKLGGSKYFAYPFFDFNDRAIELLKKAGFDLAFIGQYDTDGYSYPNKTNKYMVRRTTIFSDTSMSEFISYLE